MSGVQHVTVAADEADMRLDRWFRRRFPDLPHGRLQRLLRSGQVRVDGSRMRAGDHVQPGQQVRVPPLEAGEAGEAAPRPADTAKPMRVTAAQAEALRDSILHIDEQVIVIDKPAGLAVQGGSNTTHHLDGMLDALTFDKAERPRLVHRLDRDTSGCLILARDRLTADRLAQGFRGRETRKLYLALLAGCPDPMKGRIDLPLAKSGHRGSARAMAREDGKRAISDFAVIDHASRRVSLAVLFPRTGRTHQLRAHMAAIGTPIVGDAKYGGRDARLKTIGLDRTLHLHAWRLTLPHPSGKGMIDVTAPIPGAMRRSMEELAFALPEPVDPFEV